MLWQVFLLNIKLVANRLDLGNVFIKLCLFYWSPCSDLTACISWTSRDFGLEPPNTGISYHNLPLNVLWIKNSTPQHNLTFKWTVINNLKPCCCRPRLSAEFRLLNHSEPTQPTKWEIKTAIKRILHFFRLYLKLENLSLLPSLSIFASWCFPSN